MARLAFPVVFGAMCILVGILAIVFRIRLARFFEARLARTLGRYGRWVARGAEPGMVLVWGATSIGIGVLVEAMVLQRF